MNEDGVIWSADEIIGSGDMTDDQSYRARTDRQQELYRQAATVMATGGATTTTPRAVVLNGLTIIPNGTDISVQPGVLAQYSTVLTPVPGALDSAYRLGMLLNATTVVMPSPGADTFYVVEARVKQLPAVTGTRLIWNGSMGVPTTVPIKQEYTVEFQLTAGGAGTVPAFTGADWIPIAIVRRPSGGGAVALTDIIDLRELWGNRLAKNNETPITTGVGYGTGRGQGWMVSPTDMTSTTDNTFLLNAEAYLPTGERVWYSGTVKGTAPFLENGLTLAASTWYYVYLAGFRTNLPNGPPAGQYNGQAWTGATGITGVGRGLVIISAVPPDLSGANSALITPGVPFQTSSDITAGFARCVGMIRRNAANTGWAAVWSDDGKTFHVGASPADLGSFYSAAPSAGGNNVTPSAGTLPAGIKSMRFLMTWVGGGGGSSQINVFLVPFGAASPTLSTVRQFDDAAAVVTGNQQMFDISLLGLSFSTQHFRYEATLNPPNAGTVVTLRLDSFAF